MKLTQDQMSVLIVALEELDHARLLDWELDDCERGRTKRGYIDRLIEKLETEREAD